MNIKLVDLKNLKLSTQIFIGFLIVLISVTISIVVSYYNSNKIMKSVSWVVHTHEVLTQLENIENRLIDLETGQRGFLITGNNDYLEPFNKSLEVIYDDLESLRQKTIDNINQTQRIDQLKKTIDSKIEELKLTIELRKKNGFEAAKEIVDNNSGKFFMDIMRIQISELRNEELRLLKLRSLEPEQIKKRTFLILNCLLVFTILIVILVFVSISHSITKPIKTLQKGIKQVGFGNLNYKFEKSPNNEIGLLTKSFEVMLDELKNIIATKEVLEEEIKSREKIEESLIESKRTIQNKNKELEQFNYIVSHDLQEPLNSIISISSFLEDDKDKMSELGQKSVELLSESAWRMKDFISSLLEYSKIGKIKEKTLVDIEQLINNLKIDLHHLIQKKQAQINYIGKPLKINAFETDLIKLFQNLIINGIKYTDKGTFPIITINVEEQEDKYMFLVTDNGIGIDEKDFDTIFEVFQRLHVSDEYSGTGIGLSHCQKVVKLHDGKIWLDSKVGKGTTFYFTISKN